MTGSSQSISKKAIQLLNKEEGYDVDFKRDMKGLKPEDLVSFANSPSGGTILVGVDEHTDASGQQRGTIYGCAIGDKEKLSILSKAGECRPPVGVEIFVENEDTDKPFYRIEIPSGQYKPYCTNKGIYQIRGDGRNNPITPEKLLDMYVELQGSAFIDRFKKATKELNDDLHQTKTQVNILNNNLVNIKEKMDQDMKAICSDLESFNRRVHGQLDDISNIAENASNNAGDTVPELQDTNGILNSLANHVAEVSEAVNALLKHFEIEHPSITKRKNYVLVNTKSLYPTFKEHYLETQREMHILSDYKTYIMELFIDKKKVNLEPSTIELLVDQAIAELKEE